MSILFAELIKVSLGVVGCLSKTPTNEKWEKLYATAKKQSLVGVCFAGVQKLVVQQQEPPEMLYLTWMGMAAKIQQRNEVVNRQCAELQAKLAADGLASCVLKGQGVALVYPEHLRGLRQSGDIDVWISGSREDTLAYVQKVAPTKQVTMLHADFSVFQDTEVEVHFKPTYLRCPWKNRRLEAWFEKFVVLPGSPTEEFDKFPKVNGFRVPSDDFNLVFLALHIFRHLLGEGIGLRQLMDYYFVLRHVQDDDTRKHAFEVLKSLGLGRFAAALMWICSKVFTTADSAQKHQEDWMICEPNEKLGQMILHEIELAGNFGQHDDRIEANESAWKRFCRTNATSLKFMRYFPEEVLCTPFYRVWHKCWQMKHGYRG